MGPKSKHKFINASHSSYAHSLKVISDNIFNNFVHETKFPGVELSTCSVVSLSHFSKSFGFWSISHFQIRDVQPGKG
jgi:aspartate/methionine/tyrosine aminotransferase